MPYPMQNQTNPKFRLPMLFDLMHLRALPFPQETRFLLSLDFDDTLFDWRHEQRISPLFFEMIKTVREEKGVIWGINTGRSFDFLKKGYEHQAKAPFAPDFVITRERDIHITDQNGYLRAYSFWNDRSTDDHCFLFKKHKGAFKNLFFELTDIFPSVAWQHQEGDEFSIEVESLSDLDKIIPHIDEFVSRYPDISIQRAGPYLRFCHVDYNKGTALQTVLRLFGVEQCNSLIVGDGYNDMDTLRVNTEARCACPDNAVEPLKRMVFERQGYVSSLCCFQGTIDSIRNCLYL